uniref:Uncharacterized protein n=1 Tax=Populus trichocarpa TaxID=3694 RepID=A0A2K1YEP7_POPTR
MTIIQCQLIINQNYRGNSKYLTMKCLEFSMNTTFHTYVKLLVIHVRIASFVFGSHRLSHVILKLSSKNALNHIKVKPIKVTTASKIITSFCFGRQLLCAKSTLINTHFQR